MNKQLSRSLNRKIMAVKQTYDIIPTILGDESVKFFKRNFKNEGFTDVVSVPWQPRKNRIKGFSTNSKSDSSRPTLTKSGDLKNSIEVTMATKRMIRIESDLPYSRIHNYGGQGLAFGKHPFKMPQRRFMGDSKALRVLLTKKIESNFNKAFRNK
jgi:phage gpG-like protein